MPCYLLHMIEAPNANPYADLDVKDLVGDFPRLFCARAVSAARHPMLARAGAMPGQHAGNQRLACAAPLLRQSPSPHPHQNRHPAEKDGNAQ